MKIKFEGNKYWVWGKGFAFFYFFALILGITSDLAFTFSIILFCLTFRAIFEDNRKTAHKTEIKEEKD